MHILLIGGTRFLGRHLIEAALTRGHEVTLFNRGKTNADLSQPGMNETAPLAALPDETVEEVTNETYGALKALCERAAERAMPGRVLNVRPGFIVGPHDPTDRFTYWPVCMKKL